MRLKQRSLLLFLLAACEPGRPAGSYTPVVDADMQVVPGDRDAGEDEPEPEPDAEVEVPEDDAGEVPIDPNEPLARFEGKFLMRHDYYSRASASDGTNTLQARIRISNLFLTEIKLEDGALKAHEQLCFQSWTQHCDRSCDRWVTEVDQSATKVFPSRAIDREYVVEGGTLTARRAWLALGFDPQGEPSEAPGSPSDPTLWRPGTGAVNVAMRTTVDAVLRAATFLTRAIRCDVDQAQLWVSQWSTEVGETGRLVGANAPIIPLDSSGSNAKALAVTGTPMYCTPEQIAAGRNENEKGFVRFKTTTLGACPASIEAFDEAFKVPIDPPAP